MRVAYPAHLKLIKFLHVGRVFPARGLGGGGGGGPPPLPLSAENFLNPPTKKNLTQ